MTRAPIIAIAGLLAFAGAAEARTPLAAEAVLVERGGIDIVSGMVLPSVSMNAGAGAAPTITSITSSQRRAPGDNASLRIQRQSGETVSMAIPETFQVVRNGGSQALTVRTIMRGGYSLNDGVLLGGALAPATLSINVAGALTPISEMIEPGAYEGALVVVVQYN